MHTANSLYRTSQLTKSLQLLESIPNTHTKFNRFHVIQSSIVSRGPQLKNGTDCTRPSQLFNYKPCLERAIHCHMRGLEGHSRCKSKVVVVVSRFFSQIQLCCSDGWTLLQRRSCIASYDNEMTANIIHLARTICNNRSI